ncbi:MAG: hypothetical protein ABJZ55_21270 [Fuerstiella sp.]
MLPKFSVPAVLRTAFIGLAVAAFSTCLACPFCLAPSQTWTEMFAEADVVVWGRLVSSDHGDAKRQPSSVVEVVKVAKGKSFAAVEQTITVPLPIFSDVNSTVLLKGSLQDIRIAGMSDTFATDSDGEAIQAAGSKPDGAEKQPSIVPVSATEVTAKAVSGDSKSLVWDFAEPVSKVAYQYITTAPPLNKKAADRLPFFVKHLEHQDDLIAADAWAEFANSRYEDIVAIKDLLPAEKLKQWILDSELSPERPGLYGMMLGLCGRQQDIAFLLEQIGPGEQTTVRFGIEGLMGGLLVLSKDEGLDFLVTSRLANPVAPTSEVFNAMSAVKYAWEYESDLFDKETLRASLRPLLKREEFQEIIVTDLARWEDWSVISELTELCATTDQDGLIRSAIGYCWQAQKSTTATDEHKRKAAGLLASVKESHPAVYRRQLMFR